MAQARADKSFEAGLRPYLKPQEPRRPQSARSAPLSDRSSRSAGRKPSAQGSRPGFAPFDKQYNPRANPTRPSQGPDASYAPSSLNPATRVDYDRKEHRKEASASQPSSARRRSRARAGQPSRDSSAASGDPALDAGPAEEPTPAEEGGAPKASATTSGEPKPAPAAAEPLGSPAQGGSSRRHRRSSDTLDALALEGAPPKGGGPRPLLSWDPQRGPGWQSWEVDFDVDEGFVRRMVASIDEIHDRMLGGGGRRPG